MGEFMVRFSAELVEKMGFRRYPADDKIEAVFSVLCIYSGQNFSVAESCDAIDCVFDVGDCRCCISNSINSAGRLLIDDQVLLDEEEWAKAWGSSSPYLLVMYTEKASTALNGGYRIENEDGIELFDMLDGELNEIRNWKRNELENVISFISVMLSQSGSCALFKHVHDFVFGMNSDGVRVKNYKLNASAEVSFLKALECSVLHELVNCSDLSYSNFDGCFSDVLYDAMNEKGLMWKVLKFFCFIERRIKYVFKNNRNIWCTKLSDERTNKLGINFKKNEFKGEGTSIKFKFYWCAIVLWDEIDISDVRQFEQLLRVRNKIAHSGNSGGLPMDVHSAMNLAIKIMGFRTHRQ